MLNMIHTENEKQAYLSDNALKDLNMSFFADAEFSKKIPTLISREKDTIIMRQREFADIISNPEISIFLDALCKKLAELSEIEKSKVDADAYSENESLLYSFRELLTFSECIDLISEAAGKFGDKAGSEGFLSLFSYAEKIKGESWYRNVLKFKQITLLLPARLSEIDVVSVADCPRPLLCGAVVTILISAAMIWFYLKRFLGTKCIFANICGNLKLILCNKSCNVTVRCYLRSVLHPP